MNAIPNPVPHRGVRLTFALLTAAAVALAGCGKGGEKADTDHDHDHGKLHVHVAPHKGTLVELGEHEASLELVRDAASGKLTGYVLDAHAENFLRIASPGFEIVAKVGGREETLGFKPSANTATGEKVGDTSQFEAQADWLKTTDNFDGVIKELTVRTKTYKDVKFNFPKGSD